MRSLAWALFIGVCLAATSGRQPSPRVINVSNADELIGALQTPLENVTIQMGPGRYVLPGTNERLGLGLCDSYVTNDLTSVGLMVSGRRVRLVGSGVEATVLFSDAYHRVCFRDCEDCEIEHVKITGQAVDRTMAGIIAIGSKVRIANCVIEDNSTSGLENSGEFVKGTRPANGVVGWKAADLTIEFNEF